MRHRTATAAGAALTAALLLTTACGTDDSSDDVAGVDEAGQKDGKSEDEDVQEPQDEAPQDDGIDRPDIELPDDMNHVFEDTETGDPVKDEIIADVVARINAIDMAFAESNPRHEAVEFYSSEGALDSAESFVRNSAEDDLSWSGTSHYYDFSVDNEGRQEGEPIVSYCHDISGMQTKELDTGNLQETPDDAPRFLQSQVVVRKAENGVWQVFQVLPSTDEGDQGCVQ